MTKAEKTTYISDLTQKLNGVNTVYVADTADLTVETVGKLRQFCFDKGVEFQVAKNTLVKKAMEASDQDFEGLYETLKGPTSLFISETANMPAKVMKTFREESDKPVLKGAFIDSSFYIGDDQIETLSNLKSKEELVAEIIALLQSPPKTVISQLQSSAQKLSGIIKTLSERSE